MSQTILNINTEPNIVVVSQSSDNNDIITQNLIVSSSPSIEIVSPLLNIGTSYINPVDPPTSTSSQGVPGEIRFDLNNLYICVLSNNWKKVPLQGL